MLALPLAAPAGAQSAPPTVSLGGSFGFDTPQIQVANSMNLWKAAGVDVKDVAQTTSRDARS
jgi:hypothetical protein